MTTPKLAHIAILEGSEDDVTNLVKALKPLKKKLGVEFLITNDKVELRDIRALIIELYTLYKKYRKTALKVSKALKGDKDDKK